MAESLAELAPVITIDGPSSSGKGTVAARVAEHLHWRLLDSGALYRVVAWAGPGALHRPRRRRGARHHDHRPRHRAGLRRGHRGRHRRERGHPGRNASASAPPRLRSSPPCVKRCAACNRACAVRPAWSRTDGTWAPSCSRRAAQDLPRRERRRSPRRRRHKQLMEKGSSVSLPRPSREHSGHATSATETAPCRRSNPRRTRSR